MSTEKNIGIAALVIGGIALISKMFKDDDTEEGGLNGIKDLTSNEFLKRVKKVLDGASWDYQYSGSSGSDAEKMVSFLEGSTFSIKSIKNEIVNLDYKDVLYNLREDKVRSSDIPKYVASMISDSIAFSRANPRKKGWSIDGSTSFHIN